MILNERYTITIRTLYFAVLLLVFNCIVVEEIIIFFNLSITYKMFNILILSYHLSSLLVIFCGWYQYFFYVPIDSTRYYLVRIWA